MTLDLRLALPAVGVWLAAGITIGLPSFIVPVIALLWVFALAVTAVAAARRSAWLVIAALTCAVAALCSSSAGLQAVQRAPPQLVAVAESGRFVTVLVETTETTVPDDQPFSARMTSFTIAGDRTAVSVPILVFGSNPAERTGIGTTLRLSGTVTATAPEDDRAFLLFANGAPETVASPPWFLEWANAVRATFVEESGGLPGAGGKLLPGLAIGDTGAVDDALDSAMKATSLSHLTAVSGANCAIVIGLIMVAGGAVGIPRGARISASLAVLIVFVVLVTPEPSVLRAALMAMLVLLSLAGGRPVRGVSVLCLAAIVLLVADPWLSRNYGFALSVLATGGLLVLAGPLTRLLAHFLPLAVAALLAVPLAAQLACQPVLILLDASLPTYGVVANLLAAPAAPAATVVGLLACLMLPVAPAFGALLTQVAWLPASWVAAVAQFFAELPASRLPWPAGIFGLVLLSVLTILGLVSVLSRWHRWPALGLVAILVVYAGAAVGERTSEQLNRPSNWQIAVCDVGQGDAVLVKSLGEVALIDTGARPDRLAHCLDELGIARIDLLVLTHFDLDHIGGTDAVLGSVERILVGPTAEPADKRFVQELIESGTTVEQVSRGLTGRLGELRWEILWPPTRLGSLEPGNEASIAMTFLPVGACRDGCLSSLFLADLDEGSQARLLSATPLPVVDVVKVSHHGSADQSQRLYERVAATIGVIGVGLDNGYGHPTERLLDILAATGTAQARTDLDGMVLLAPGDEAGTVSVWTERSTDSAPG